MCKEINRWGHLSHQRCGEIWARMKKNGRLGPNTVLMPYGKNFVVFLYSTRILTFRPDGSVILNSGGNRTATTKQRLNALGPVYITKNKGVWGVGPHEFFDGFLVGGGPEEFAIRKEIALGPDRELARMALKDYLAERGYDDRC